MQRPPCFLHYDVVHGCRCLLRQTCMERTLLARATLRGEPIDPKYLAWKEAHASMAKPLLSASAVFLTCPRCGAMYTSDEKGHACQT